MTKVFYAIVVGLVGAGIVHVAMLLLLPSLSQRDAWTALSAAAPLYETVAQDRAPAALGRDPFLSSAACRFDLSDGPVTVTAEGTVPFWSVSVYGRRGQNLYSLTDRALAGRLAIMLLDPSQAAAQHGAEPDPEAPTPVQVDTDEGILVLRGFDPDPSWNASVRAFLASLRCARPADTAPAAQ
ncbi:MAG: DUF1254 domain-containing protein [Methylobacterium mesophilicum]|nr:DUF1254 domain-containing protein [Methylobacterium mesophilicum]